MLKIYEKAELNIIEFDTKDIIVTSDPWETEPITSPDNVP